MAKKAKIGDVYRIQSKNYFFYIQYTHNNDEYGYLLRKLHGVFKNSHISNDDLNGVINDVTSFYFFFPLQTAINSSEKKQNTIDGNPIYVKLVGNFKIPKTETIFPKMIVGQAGNWGIWNGDSEVSLGSKLPSKYKKYSVAGIINYEFLISRIDNNYIPENDPFVNM